MKNAVQGFLCTWVALSEKFAKTTLLVLMLITAFAGHFAWQNFSINSDLGNLIKPSNDNRWYTDNEDYKAAFPQYQDTALVIVSGASAADVYDGAQALTHSLRSSGHFEDVFAPAYDTFFQDHALYSAPTEGVRRISEAVTESLPRMQAIIESATIATRLQQLQERIDEQAELEYLKQDTHKELDSWITAIAQLEQQKPADLALIKPLKPRDTDDIHYQIIVLKSQQLFSEELPNAVIVKNIRDSIDNTPLPEKIDVRLSGEVVLANEEISAGLSGVELAGTISLLLLAIILGIGIRSLSVITAIFAMLFAGIVWTAAFASATVGSYNTLSLVFLVMFFGLGVDFAVHYSLKLVEVSHQSHPGQSGAVAATADLGTTLMLCAFTSSIAFLAFLPTAYNGLAELGIISAGGMCIAFILSLSLFPAWFSFFGHGKTPNIPEISPSHKIQALPPKAVLITTVLISLIALYFAKDVQFSYSVLAMRDKNSEAMSTLLELQKNHVVTDYSISVLAQEEDIPALKASLLALDSVANVETASDFLPEFQGIKAGYINATEEALSPLHAAKSIPLSNAKTSAAIDALLQQFSQYNDVFYDEDAQKIADFQQALLQLNAMPDSWAALQQAIVDGINADVAQLQRWFSAEPYGLKTLPDNVRRRLMTDSGQQLLNVIPTADMTNRQNTDRFIAEVSDNVPNIAGRTIVEWGVGKVVVESFQQAVAIAVCAIMALLLIYFRSIRTSLLVLIPLCLATLFTFAIVKATGLTLNMANILVVPLIFGLGVDTGIHIVHRYEQDGDIQQLFQSSTSKAVLISALTTIATFFSLSFSPHKGAASVGLLLSISISILLLTTFLVLPALLALFSQKSKK